MCLGDFQAQMLRTEEFQPHIMDEETEAQRCLLGFLCITSMLFDLTVGSVLQKQNMPVSQPLCC